LAAKHTHSPEDSPVPPRKSSDSYKLAMVAVRVAAENRGRDIMVLDMRERTPLFDYFVIVTGRSGRQIKAISDEIDHTMNEQLGDHCLRTEGYKDSRWIVLDYGDVLIHVFDEAMREFYRLEDLWADAKRVDITAIVDAVK
jgi:ribosome-associated protein